ncbi:hypothetical protein ACFOLD_00705 [Kocuria carniphila]|uniref:hypothetical protein n=1 Tax=Kocuria carniphila TaxID=262208 RepID=UPI003613EF88
MNTFCLSSVVPYPRRFAGSGPLFAAGAWSTTHDDAAGNLRVEGPLRRRSEPLCARE